MSLEMILNVVSSLAMIGPSLAPIYMASRLRSSPLRTLSVLLALFAVTHGIYHLTEIAAMDVVADTIVEPLSWFLLLAFSLYFAKKAA